MERNKEREKREGPPAPNSAIQLPFIIVNTSKKTVIDCSISNDKMEYLFNFDDTFEIHDDMEVSTRRCHSVLIGFFPLRPRRTKIPLKYSVLIFLILTNRY